MTDMLRVYLDNVIASSRVLGNLWPESELKAVAEIDRLHSVGKLKRVTSRLSWREQDRAAEHKRQVLREHRDEVSVVQADHRLVGFNHVEDEYWSASSPIITDIVDDALFATLQQAGLHKDDAKHLMYAAANDCQVFATTDSDFLSRRSELEEMCARKLRILRPSELIRELSTADT
jgi:hypothetical protein